MSFYKQGRELPLSKESYHIENNAKSKISKLDDHKLDNEILSGENEDSYATYLASLIYEYQMDLKYELDESDSTSNNNNSIVIRKICRDFKGILPNYILNRYNTGLNLVLISIFLLFVNFIFTSVYGQDLDTIRKNKPLNIGEKMPKFLWNQSFHVLNHPEKLEYIQLENYRGKILIINFLSTGCRSCIEAVNKLNILQKQFKNDIQFLLVTNEKKNRVESYIKHNVIMKENLIPIIYEDHLLKEHFPHRYISHLVWLNKYGDVEAITGSNQVQDFTIRNFIIGKAKNWPIKTESTSFFGKPLISLPLNPSSLKSDENKILYYTLLTDYKEGVGPYSSSNDESQLISRYSLRNRSLLELYLIAVDRLYKYDPLSDQVILNVSDKSKLDFIYADSSTLTKEMWLKMNGYCYERTHRPNTSDSVKKKLLLKDLNEFLNLQGRLIVQDGREIFLLEEGKPLLIN